jgi:zinc protease
VSVLLAVRAGSINDPPGQEGLADLVAGTIDLGTRTRKALQIEDALGDLGTSMGGGARLESSSLSMEVLSRNLDPALALFADVVQNPTFPQTEIDREKKRRLDMITQMEKQPESIAFRVSSMLVFGPEHPYGRPTQGFKGTVQGLQQTDFAQFHRRLYLPGAAALVLAGDITLAQAKALAEKHLGRWTGQPVAVVAIPEAQPFDQNKIYIVDRQDASSTIVTQVLPGPPRQTEDYFALQLADAVFGGSFTSRLNMNLREDKGYSYGVRSMTMFFSKAGIWQTFGSVHGDKTKESVAEFGKELKALAADKPITDLELEQAKANRIRGYAQGFESLYSVAAQVARLWSFGLPMGELQREPGELEKAALAAVNAAAKRYAVPSKAALLLVGDRTKIEAGLKDLKIGEIVLLDAEGKPVRK